MSRIGTFEFARARDDDDEGLFSRDIDGVLVRLDAPSEADYQKTVNLTIDGRPVQVKLAEPLKDAQGNAVQDVSGKTTPRYTTIYDAAVKAATEAAAEREGREAADGAKQADDGTTAGSGPLAEGKIPIPILCHQPHMKPVAVCRLCVVQIYGQKRGKRSAERKLLPACQHQVKEGMEVFTMYHTDKQPDGTEKPSKDAAKVQDAVGVITELLTCDHLKQAPSPELAGRLSEFNELARMADTCHLTSSRFAELAEFAPAPKPAPAKKHRPLDISSPVFMVDHSACVLCDRCSRACVEVKKNNIIGRVGKGVKAGIAFDLDEPMGESGCVQCGECMVSCPTSAITFKPVAKVDIPKTAGSAQVLKAEELKRDPLFGGIPGKFLLWQEGLALRRTVHKGDVLCRQGDPGNTAFVLKKGKFDVVAYQEEEGKKSGFFRLLGKGAPRKEIKLGARGPEDTIIGEMACLSGSPRTADVVALEDGEVWEVRRNVLDRAFRSPSARSVFEKIYRSRALRTALLGSELFRGLPEAERQECVKFLADRLSFVRVNPGMVIFRQGDFADALYLVRLGHLRVAISQNGRERTVLYRGPGTVIGEIGLLAISAQDVKGTKDAKSLAAELDQQMGAALNESPDAELSSVLPAGPRTASCSALDHVEMARVSRADFLEMVKKFPGIRRRLVETAVERLTGGSGDDTVRRSLNRDFIEKGLYQAQHLLAMDLTKCTHCDECTKACVDQHGTETHGQPVTRLLRDGTHFGDFLVASSCRSCKDAYCMIGCPVDAIHRGKHQQIVIEDHCIGCNLCANNCPYGNIFMVPNLHRQMEAPDPENPGRTIHKPRPRAATCDLCDAEGERDTPLPRCVYACPHDAAQRLTGDELFKQVESRLAVHEV